MEAGLDKLRDIVLFVAGLVALGSLVMAAYEGLNQRVPGAIFLGTLGVACTFMVFMPKLEFFKLWGMEARLSKTLDRAEEILGKLQRLSIISAKSTFMSLAWTNRMDGPSPREKQAILNDVDRQLAELNVTPDERAAAVHPYVMLIGWDFYTTYTRTLDRYFQFKDAELLRKYQADNTDKALRDLIQKRGEAIGTFRSTIFSDGLFKRVQDGQLEAVLNEAKPGILADEKETKIVERFKDEVLALYKGCVEKGGYTTAAADFMEKIRQGRGEDLKIIELFGFDPSELR